MPATVEFVELERAECLRLLASQPVGRVVFTDAALPAARPVNFIVDGEEVVFRTRGDGQLATVTRDTVVAFEADYIDPQTRTGWSVLGVGHAYEVLDPARHAELAERRLEPWPPDHAGVIICIPLQLLSGRRISRDGGG